MSEYEMAERELASRVIVAACKYVDSYKTEDRMAPYAAFMALEKAVKEAKAFAEKHR